MNNTLPFTKKRAIETIELYNVDNMFTMEVLKPVKNSIYCNILMYNKKYKRKIIVSCLEELEEVYNMYLMLENE